MLKPDDPLNYRTAPELVDLWVKHTGQYVELVDTPEGALVAQVDPAMLLEVLRALDKTQGPATGEEK